jgi:HD-GYP domain-containing protein (c-di-GMP phosphodiesterase class II)
MSSDRPYRPALGLQKAIEELRKNREVLYDSAAADACLDLLESDRFKIE